MNTISVMVVEDHLAVRDSLALMLRVFSDIQLVAQAENGAKALEMLKQITPDVILMDLLMPEMNGIEATRKILEQKPHIKIIALTSFEEEELVNGAQAAGVTALLHKTCTIDQLATAIRQAAGNNQP